MRRMLHFKIPFKIITYTIWDPKHKAQTFTFNRTWGLKQKDSVRWCVLADMYDTLKEMFNKCPFKCKKILQRLNINKHLNAF